MLRLFFTVVVAVTSWVGCGDRNPAPLSGRAPAQLDFRDNELLVHVPDDTPYAFASFKPLPLELFEQMSAAYKPVFDQALQVQNEETKLLRTIAEEIGTFSVLRLEELGLSAKARFVVYGLGMFPVVRVEVRDGFALLGFIQRVAQRLSYTLPAPIDEHGRKIWRIDGEKDVTILLALAKSEVVIAIAPPAVIDMHRALIVGTRKPARSLPTERFREIARRHGYSAQAVGFLELPRLVTALVTVAGADAPPPACTSAIVAFAKRAPRVTMGYDEITRKRMSGGMVLELAPDVLADAKTLSTHLAGLDRLRDQEPLFAIAAAADLSRARDVASRATNAVRTLASACTSNELAQLVSQAETALSRPLPAYLEGVKGGLAVLTAIEVTPDGAKKIDGWGVVNVNHTAHLLAMAARELPGLGLAPDGVARPLPEGFGVLGAIAASHHAIAVALGEGSARIAADLLHATPSRAPLLMFEMDLKRLYDAMAALGEESEDDAMTRAMAKMYGPMSFTIDVDDRGLVGWGVFELE